MPVKFLLLSDKNIKKLLLFIIHGTMDKKAWYWADHYPSISIHICTICTHVDLYIHTPVF